MDAWKGGLSLLAGQSAVVEPVLKLGTTATAVTVATALHWMDDLVVFQTAQKLVRPGGGVDPPTCPKQACHAVCIERSVWLVPGGAGIVVQQSDALPSR